MFDDLAWAKGVSTSILQRLQRKEGRGDEAVSGATEGEGDSIGTDSQVTEDAKQD